MVEEGEEGMKGTMIERTYELKKEEDEMRHEFEEVEEWIGKEN